MPVPVSTRLESDPGSVSVTPNARNTGESFPPIYFHHRDSTMSRDINVRFDFDLAIDCGAPTCNWRRFCPIIPRGPRHTPINAFRLRLYPAVPDGLLFYFQRCLPTCLYIRGERQGRKYVHELDFGTF
jgi:hypothetical protein